VGTHLISRVACHYQITLHLYIRWRLSSFHIWETYPSSQDATWILGESAAAPESWARISVISLKFVLIPGKLTVFGFYRLLESEIQLVLNEKEIIHVQLEAGYLRQKLKWELGTALSSASWTPQSFIVGGPPSKLTYNIIKTADENPETITRLHKASLLLKNPSQTKATDLICDVETHRGP